MPAISRRSPRTSRRRASSAALASLALLTAIAVAKPAAASPEDILGFGARSSAMGATGAASSEGYESVYGNPALLSLSRHRELTLGFVGATFDLRLDPIGTPSSRLAPYLSPGNRISYEPLHGTLIGATLPLPFGGVLQDRIAIGVGFFTPTDLVVRGRILYPETPQFPIADRTQSVAVQAGIGVHVFRGLRIGGGFAALAALSGSVEVATDASGRIGTTVQDTLVASYGPIVGASYDFADDYRVGLTFRGALVGRFNVVINVKDLGSLVVPPLNISGIAQYDPWQVAFEVAKVKGKFRMAMGATFKRWSEYPGAADATVRCPLLDPGTLQPFSGVCGVLSPPPPNYRDTVGAHVGVERLFEPAAGVGTAVRGGVLFEPSPAPAQTSAANVFDNHRLAFTLGYGLTLGPPLPRLSIDLFTQLHWLIPRDNVKDATVSASNPAAPSVESRGFIVAAGTALGVKF